MPRSSRLFQRALCYHVMNRGVNRQGIFQDDEDRRYFTQTVAEYKALCGARIYHWCWMDNHYHVLVEVVHENLRAFAGGLQQAYAQYHHARHHGSGVFWQGRYKSRPVEVGSYLASCGRYIERNPVRAGLTGKPATRGAVRKRMGNWRKSNIQQPTPNNQRPSWGAFPWIVGRWMLVVGR